MRLPEIEAWTRRVVERALSGLPNEDARVELKGELPPDASRAARRIAGHCNAARSSFVLWVVGVDEKARRIVSVTAADRATWWGSVKVEFDLLHPQLTDLVVPTQWGDVLALLFDTSRAPFVVKNPAYGRPSPAAGPGDSVQFEVPWREGTSTRSARRDDLLVLLIPSLQLPHLEILDVRVEACEEGESPDRFQNWDVTMDLYVVPRSEHPVTIPFHASRLTVTPPGAERALVAPEVRMRRQSTPGGPPNLSAAVVSSYSEVVVRGPSAVVVDSNFSTRRRYVPDGGALGVDLAFTPALADHPINTATTVPQSGQPTRPGSTLWLMEQSRPQERYHEGRMLPPVVD